MAIVYIMAGFTGIVATLIGYYELKDATKDPRD